MQYTCIWAYVHLKIPGPYNPAMNSHKINQLHWLCKYQTCFFIICLNHEVLCENGVVWFTLQKLDQPAWAERKWMQWTSRSWVSVTFNNSKYKHWNVRFWDTISKYRYHFKFSNGHTGQWYCIIQGIRVYPLTF